MRLSLVTITRTSAHKLIQILWSFQFLIGLFVQNSLSWGYPVITFSNLTNGVSCNTTSPDNWYVLKPITLLEWKHSLDEKTTWHVYLSKKVSLFIGRYGLTWMFTFRSFTTLDRRRTTTFYLQLKWTKFWPDDRSTLSFVPSRSPKCWFVFVLFLIYSKYFKVSFFLIMVFRRIGFPNRLKNILSIFDFGHFRDHCLVFSLRNVTEWSVSLEYIVL